MSSANALLQAQIQRPDKQTMDTGNMSEVVLVCRRAGIFYDITNKNSGT